MGETVVRAKKLRDFKSNGEAFDQLHSVGIIDDHQYQNIQKLFGFRELALYNYENIDLDIVDSIIRDNLPELERLVAELLKNAK
jgi:uncharacterized protein YutE (UPF0331/DUF86 family)